MGITIVIRHRELGLPIMALFHLGDGEAEPLELLAHRGEDSASPAEADAPDRHRPSGRPPKQMT